jgi:excisionase family DNA binding protein
MSANPTLQIPSIAVNLPQDTVDAIVNFVEQNVFRKLKESPELLKSLVPAASADSNVTQEDFILYTTEEVAEKLRCSEVTVRTLCKQKKLGYSRPSGKNIVVSKRQLGDYLNNIAL